MLESLELSKVRIEFGNVPRYQAILYFAPTVLPAGDAFTSFLGNFGIGVCKFTGELIAGFLADSPRFGIRSHRVNSTDVVDSGLNFRHKVAVVDEWSRGERRSRALERGTVSSGTVSSETKETSRYSEWSQP